MTEQTPQTPVPEPEWKPFGVYQGEAKKPAPTPEPAPEPEPIIETP